MPSATDDLSLMQAIARGDRSAMEALYDRHAGLVFAVCRRVLHSADDAEDAVTDVFLELWTRADRYDGSRGSPVTYIVTLARSRAIDRKRSQDVRPKPSADLDEAAARPSHVPSPADSTSFTEQAAKVRKALGELDPAQQEALSAAFYDGLTHTQIAAKLKKPLGTIKTYIRQGLIRLRDVMRINE